MLCHRRKKIAIALSLLGVAAGMGITMSVRAQEVQGSEAASAVPAAEPQAGEGRALPPRPPRTAAAPEAGAEPLPVKRAWVIVPQIEIAETFTDNVAPGSGSKRSDQVTTIGPGIRVDGDTARLKLHADFRVNQLLYAQESQFNNTQRFLNAYGTLEAMEKWLYLDFSGAIRQQNVSPFGLQTASNTLANGNRTEVSTFGLSPYVRGRLAGYADYEVRYRQSATHAKSGPLSDLDTREWSGRIGGGTPLAGLSWTLDGNREDSDFNAGRKHEADSARALLSYRFTPQFSVNLRGGREANDYVSTNKESRNIHGYGFEWTPSERTALSAVWERRFFGNGHNVSFSHRTPLSAWRFSDTRDYSFLPYQLTQAGQGTIYDLMFSQMASTVPDPAARAQAVTSQLQQLGIAPDPTVASGFLVSRVSVARRQELSFVLQGARNVLTLSAVRSENQAVGSAAGPSDPFLASSTIRQRGANIDMAHRLTPLTTLNVLASRMHTSGAGGSALATDQKSLQAGVTTRLGPSTSASLGARRNLFKGNATTPSFSENAVLAMLTMHF